MKALLIFISIFGFHFSSFSQTNKFPDNGNAGIGTYFPQYNLQVQKTSAQPAIMIGGGYAGSPRLQIYGLDSDANAWMGLGTDMSGNSYEHSVFFSSGVMNAKGRLTIGDYNGTIYNPRMTVLENGSIGIGTTSPTTGLLAVQGVITSQTATTLNTGNNDAFNLYAGGGGYTDGARQSILWSQSGLVLGRFGTEYNLPRGQVDFVWRDQYNSGGSSSEAMRLTGGGNLGIGTHNPGEYKLAVNGKVRAHEIKVETANWPDYVFAKEYQLPTLSETEKHIKEKGHLPGIPSALEVKANGIDLGEMNAKLLQKIDELTLHLINKDKEVTDLKHQIEQQDAKVKLILNKLKL